jgi:hypothetical protein
MPKPVEFVAEIASAEDFPTRVLGVPQEYLDELKSGNVLIFAVTRRTVIGRFNAYRDTFKELGKRIQVAVKDNKTYVRLVDLTTSPERKPAKRQKKTE